MLSVKKAKRILGIFEEEIILQRPTLDVLFLFLGNKTTDNLQKSF